MRTCALILCVVVWSSHHSTLASFPGLGARSTAACIPTGLFLHRVAREPGINSHPTCNRPAANRNEPGSNRGEATFNRNETTANRDEIVANCKQQGAKRSQLSVMVPDTAQESDKRLAA